MADDPPAVAALITASAARGQLAGRQAARSPGQQQPYAGRAPAPLA